ncbi:SAVED domain-containing protein [Massilia sp. CCM 8695]|uniref:SAVED domain-containing protein n=1 Tax=Massilia frigida TaxID=2609281 RepID=A0ABX0NJY3_9BURK|nr:SAVED domain-containing protein [Massilia frigida]NHZ83960.1 SAVED domain-containing protein [Massilia frigida]
MQRLLTRRLRDHASMKSPSPLHVTQASPNCTGAASPPWADPLLAQWLNRWQADGKTRVTFVHAAFQCAFYADDGTDALDRADPEKFSFGVLRKLAKAGRLFQLEVPVAEFQAAKHRGADWDSRSSPASQPGLAAWKGQRDLALGQGRGRPLKAGDEKLIWHDAGGRCMYRGCAKDVGRTPLTGKAAAAAYLAHIVASDEDGPRGDYTSQTLSDDPENVMLMCDEHHRLIDRIDVDGHPAQKLNDMRREHVEMVRRALDGLAFRRSKAVALLADVADLKTSAAERDIQKAVLQRGLTGVPGVDYLVRRTQRDDRTQPDFWRHLLHEHEGELLELRRKLGSNQPLGDGCEVLSVFALHPVPLLVLFGRIVGEARPVEVYQYDRTRATWCWDERATPNAPGTFSLDTSNTVSSSDVMLSIELTAEVDVDALPPELKQRLDAKSLPWVRIRNANPSESCIRTGADLDAFTAIAREAVRHIQDTMRSSHVHLIGVAPVSTLFRFGQLLQPGHHSTYTVYDRPNRSVNFLPGLTITGDSVVDAAQSHSSGVKTILLR